MPRIRTIKPEFWDSPDTARASLRARLLYIAMWNWADDWGIGSANAKQLLAFAFPNDDITASELPTLVKEVSDCFGVVVYESNRRPYYAIPSWDEHQRTERKAKRVNPSPPDGITAGQGLASVFPMLNLGTSDASEGNAHEGTGEREREREELPCASGDARDGSALPGFDAFWDAYDKKRDRKTSEAKYRLALKRKGVTPESLLDAAKAYITSQQAKGKHPEFTKDPARWLNGHCWEDEVDPVSAAAEPPSWRAEPPPPPPDEVMEDPDARAAWQADWRAGRPVPTANGDMAVNRRAVG